MPPPWPGQALGGDWFGPNRGSPSLGSPRIPKNIKIQKKVKIMKNNKTLHLRALPFRHSQNVNDICNTRHYKFQFLHWHRRTAPLLRGPPGPEKNGLARIDLFAEGFPAKIAPRRFPGRSPCDGCIGFGIFLNICDNAKKNIAELIISISGIFESHQACFFFILLVFNYVRHRDILYLQTLLKATR